VTAVLLPSHPELAFFVIGAVALGLLLIGIHNAWDSVTHVVISSAGGGTTQAKSPAVRPRSASNESDVVL
jgi:hypothetical protein